MPRRLVFFVAFLIAGAPRFVVLAAGMPIPVILAVFMANGFAAGFLNPILGAIDYERIPRHMLGRVGAIGDALSWAGIPVGGVLAGVVVGATGLVPALLIGAIAYALVTNLTGLHPGWRAMSHQPAAAEPTRLDELEAEAVASGG
jgi:predicted MFS family arabinose efflux permease